MPVLVGLAPGVTVTLSVVCSPADTDDGEADPVAAGGVRTGAPQTCNAEAELRGAGAAAVKSAELLSVSVQPLPARKAASVLLKVGAGLASEKLALPYPTRSMIWASCVG